MKKLLIPVFALLMFSACSKNNDAPTSSTFEVKLDGQLVTFNIQSSILSISTGTSEKRLDIEGLSTDGTKKLTLVFSEENATGNGITVKAYPVYYFNNDDENTPEDESIDDIQGLMHYGYKSGNNFIFEVFGIQANFAISSCDANAKRVSGTFSGKLVNLDDDTVYAEFTEGKFNNVAYTVDKR